jgi:hypothetical protein
MNTIAPDFDKVQSKKDISRLVQADRWRMEVLLAAERLNLPDWWIGAGFLRNLIWDTIEGKPTEATRDVDLVYFDPQHIEPERDWAFDEQMQKESPFADWEVRNQARMHYVNNFAPYSSTEDGIAHWVETATCIAIKYEQGRFRYLFCHGTADLFGLIARPTAVFQAPELIANFRDRVEQKQWQQRWRHLQVLES